MIIRVNTPLTYDLIRHLGFTYNGITKSYMLNSEPVRIKWEKDSWQLYFRSTHLRSIDHLETLIDAFRLLGTGWSLLAVQLQDLGYS